MINNPHSPRLPAYGGNPIEARHFDDNVRKSELDEKTRFSSLVMIASVIEVNQQLGVYRLRATGTPDMTAVPLGQHGFGLVLGTRGASFYGVGAKVVAMATPEMGVSKAVILGAVPECMQLSGALGCAELTPGSPVGSTRDAIAYQGRLNSGYNNFNNGHALDAYPGDTVRLNALGCGLWIGALHASLVSGYGASVECHYVDDLVRISSYNFEQSTAGSETLQMADGGDYTEVRRLNPYVMETLGAPYQYGALPLDAAKSRAEVESPGDDTGRYKLKDDRQQGWWRRTDLDGYLPNLHLTYVTVPYLTGVRTAEGAEEQQDETGVFREHVDSSGAYSVTSAKSIALIKDCLIPVPRELRRPDDSQGAKFGTLEQDRAANEPRMADYEVASADGQTAPSALYGAAASDAAAFRAHRATVNFAVRKDDWKVWGMDEVDLAGFRAQVDSQGMLPAADNIVEGRVFAKLPKVATLKISAKEDVRYFASRAMVLLNDDGSIHLQDGYGSAISMRGGCIDITCPGDIVLRPGRNLVSLAGDTVSMVSGNDVELAANRGDVRVHADRNVAVLSGNDGAGGILLETKAVSSVITSEDSGRFQAPEQNSNAYGGIWFKSRGAAVCTVAEQVYVGNAGETSEIRLDTGAGSLTAEGSRHVFQASQTAFITDSSNPSASTSLTLSQPGIMLRSPGSVFLQGQSLLASGVGSGNIQFLVRGSAFFSESLQTGSVAALTPQVASLERASVNNLVRDVNTAISDRQQALTDLALLQKELDSTFTASVVGENGTSLPNLTFCYPDSKLRGISMEEPLVLIEGEWQQQYRLQGAGAPMTVRGVDTSVEAGAGPVGVSDEFSYFWPGAEALAGGLGLLQAGQSRLVDEKLRFRPDVLGGKTTPCGLPGTFEGNYTIPVANRARTTQ